MKYLILLLTLTTTLSAQRTPITPDYEIGEELIILGDTTMSLTSGTINNEYTTKCDTFLAIAVEYTWGPPSWQEQPKVISLYETRCRKHYTGTTLRFVNEWPTSTYYNLDFTPFVEDKSKFYIFMIKPIKYD